MDIFFEFASFLVKNAFITERYKLLLLLQFYLCLSSGLMYIMAILQLGLMSFEFCKPID
jgi:hypothetical protein